MILHSRTIGDSGEDLVILHGLFGSGDNWQTHAKTLSQHYRVHLIDQRNHGHSPHSNTMDYVSMAGDLHQTLQTLSVSSFHLLGHSMGGKTALTYAKLHPDQLKSLIVADMGIKSYPSHHDAIYRGLYAVNAKECPSRKEAEIRLTQYVKEMSTQQFLLKNLYWIEEGKLAWRFNLDVLHDNMKNILDEIRFEKPVEVKTLFYRGGKSGYILDQDMDKINEVFTHAQLQTIPEAGHWLHVEAPTEFIRGLHDFLQS